jgi:regulator of protease activity HflC (stomatin/prohibitin superfamily)
MERNIQRTGVVNLVVLLLVGLAAGAVSRYANLLAGQVATVFLGLGVLVAAVSWFQMRLEERERIERLEFDEVTRGQSSGALFNTQEAEAFPARRAREQFERFLVPGFSVLLFLVEAVAALLLWRWVQQAPATPIGEPLMAMGLTGLFALVLFLIGRYTAGLARIENERLLRPGASYLLLGAYLCALVFADLAAFKAGFPADRYVAFALGGVLALLAAEALVTLVLEIYRPRVKGRVEHLLYDSRLVGLLSRPEGLFTTAAHVLDYQFGFKVSETWFYKFLERALAWLLLAQLGLLLLSTCLVVVEVGEQGVLERFGRPVPGRALLDPGLHFTFPWPIDQVHRHRTDRVQTFTVGHAHAEEEHGHEANTVLWTVQHAEEEFLLLVANRRPAGPSVASPVTDTNRVAVKPSPPVSLLGASIRVQYQVTNLMAWAYGHQDPSALLEHIGTREVARFLVHADLTDITSTRRLAGSEELRRLIQDRTQERNLGVRILSVGLADLHPPVKVAAAYEAVVAAKQKRAAALLEAAAHRARTNALASAEALRRTRHAEADSRRAAVGARARAALFTNQISAFRAAPEVYAQRSYLQALVRSGGSARKYILATTNAQEVIQFNLEDKLRPDLLDMSLPAPAKP